MSDTPRTEAALLGTMSFKDEHVLCVSADFARELERELNEQSQFSGKMLSAAAHHKGENDKLWAMVAQKDEALKAAYFQLRNESTMLGSQGFSTDVILGDLAKVDAALALTPLAK